MSESIAIARPNINVTGTITVRLLNGRHFTYRIREVKKGDLKGSRIVELLTGPDNTSNYKAFGFVTEKGNIRIWTKCYTEAFSKHALLLMGEAQNQVEMWYQAGKCNRCGRLLTDPDSVTRGLGPKCANMA
jgi:hypothetical protein